MTGATKRNATGSTTRKPTKREQSLAFDRHRRKCVVCHHPDRDEIEEEFLHWRSPYELARYYKISDHRSLYRHARATGLLDLRRHNFHSALDSLVEAAADARVTGDCVIRAIRAYSCIDRQGRWTEIPTQVNFTTANFSSDKVERNENAPRPTAPSPHRSTVIDLVEPDPAPELQSESDSEAESDFDTEPGFEVDGQNQDQNGGHINDEQGFALDPELEAELVAKISSPEPENPAARDVNLIYRRAIRTGLNALKT